MDKKRLIIIDSNAIIHRAFHALPPLTTKKGEVVNAIYGFLLFFLKALNEFKPDYIAATFDFPAPTFRHKEYKEYKATRVKAPEELYNQIPKVKEILKEFDIAVFEKEGYEADDLIGTISFLAENKDKNIETIILTGDADTFQLVDENTKVLAIRKGVKDTVLYDIDKVKEKYQGVLPSQLVDLKGLRGDPSDNIPGVFGIGEKTAINLIKEFDTIENLYANLDKVKESLKEKLKSNKEKAFLSKKLSKIENEVPVDFSLEDCLWEGFDDKKTEDILTKYEFFSLLKRIKEPNSKNAKVKKEAVNQNLKLF